VEVRSFDELRALGDRAKGKIVFFNRPMDPTLLNTFEAYGGAVDQRGSGAVEAAKAGAVAALVRSVTLARDNVPHTGAMHYDAAVPKAPAAAVGTLDANLISALLRKGENVVIRLRLSCETLPDAPSGNVLGQITGWEKPDEVIVVGGHLDSWDKGTGAHDDGSGCMQAIEVLNLFKKLNMRPRRTIRAVMFMNEENGNRGGKAYPKAPGRAHERQIAAIESDAGGFAPRGLSVEADSLVFERVLRWRPLFASLNAGDIVRGGSGVDIDPLVKGGTAGIGVIVENHRYFDYHHSANDTIDKVNPRELEMGAIVQALLCYLISEEGLAVEPASGR
jgi:Zn-dependent M28 family amino/carboxypeptidase